MAIRDRLNRLMSRKSLSGSGSSGSGSTTGDDTSPLPSGAVTPVSSSAPCSTPPPVVAAVGEPLTKASSANRLAKTLTWRSNRTNTGDSNSSSDNNGTSSRPKKPAKQLKGILKNKNHANRIHPSERPMTVENLHQQELLSHFTMTFGRRQSTWSCYSNVSPCCSRAPSIDAGVRHVEDRLDSEDSS